MRQLILAAVFGLVIAGGAAAQDIGGKYSVQGTNANGSTYSGTAKIVLVSDSTCEIYWTTGGSTSQGMCMRSGDVFSAAYTMSNVMGMVIYKVHKDGSMDGIWTVAGQDGSGTEVLSPQ